MGGGKAVGIVMAGTASGVVLPALTPTSTWHVVNSYRQHNCTTLTDCPQHFTGNPSDDDCKMCDDSMWQTDCHLTVTAMSSKRLTPEQHLLSEPKSSSCNTKNRAEVLTGRTLSKGHPPNSVYVASIAADNDSLSALVKCS